MKNIFPRFTCFIVLCVVLLASCTKTNTTNPNPANSNNTSMAANINGVPWNAATVNEQTNSGIIQITGGNGSGTLVLQLSSTAPGNYVLGTGTSILYSNGQFSYISSSGNITVTSFVNNKITGTFQGTLVNVNNTSDITPISNGTYSAVVQ